MFVQMLTELEKQFFSGLNLIAEPLIRAGFGNPVLLPTGTIVVETTGRTSGRKINVPVLATRFGNVLVFGTVRGNSQWVKNLMATPDVRYWLAGQPREANASVIAPNETASLDKLPPRSDCLVQFLQQQSRLLGISFALLTPRS